ncbi:hypothetical protein BTM25_21790 [Actinomadura rubteroloni]|uniref:DNA-binding protein n=1 Tax=Actinomadura rubteroloni TaxID=1926885 RepID=A0A2P4URT3_9ACTN|nr:hypothetical protein [Actinomadura rubteroloni]POM27760.1 hypothetical protein BTM25_21790 [Actinomadura rubteroloni]
MSVPLPHDPRASTLYLDWAKAHGHDHAAAERLVETLRTGAARVHRKPRRFVDELARETRGLPPDHVPWYWDTVGHRLLRAAPRAAGEAYVAARRAERDGALPVDPDFRLANAALFARHGALPAGEVRALRDWLAAAYPADRAHELFANLVLAWRKAPPPAELPRLVRASARAAGHGPAEESRILARVLAACAGTELSDGLLDRSAATFAAAPPEDPVALAGLFPTGATDGAAFLRMLDAAGALTALADGAEPEGGLAAWLGGFPFHYSYVRVPYGGITRQPMPAELFAAVERVAPRLAATPVTLHRSRFNGTSSLDADLLDACLAAGVPVTVPELKRLTEWGAASVRDLKAVAAHPEFGPLLEHTLRSGPGTAVTRLRPGSGIEASVHARIEELLAAVTSGGARAAEQALAELDGVLDTPTLAALDGTAAALAALDLTAPLLRTLRAGIPAELAWPAYDAAVAELDEIAGTTATWPVLTLFGGGRAIAVGPSGRVGACAYTLPDDAGIHTVHYADGDFLVAWTADRYAPRRAFWASDPGTVATLASADARGVSESAHWEYGDEFAVPGGRFDGKRVQRPGEFTGIAYPGRQLSDGTRVWATHSSPRTLDDYTAEDGTPLPSFFTAPRAGYEIEPRLVFLAPAPDSPLGGAEGLSGSRVLVPEGRDPDHYIVETLDGRSARIASKHIAPYPFGIARMPGGAADTVLQRAWQIVRGVDPADGTVLWEAPTHGAGTPVPPPLFWHLLAPRDPASSRALRAADASAARALLDGGAVPGVADPVIAATAADLAARLADARDRLVRRAEVVASGALVRPPAEAADTALLPALRGLVALRGPGAPDGPPSPLPATLTAIAADGRFLDGAVTDEVRRLSRPAAPCDWPVLLGAIGAVALRAVTAATSGDDRAALVALLRTWADTPFARPGEWRYGYARSAASGDGTVTVAPPRFVQWASAPLPADATKVETAVTGDDAALIGRVLDLLAEHGPVTFGDAAAEEFARRTGVRPGLARYVLDGLPRRAEFGSDRVTSIEEQEKALRSYTGSKTAVQEAENLLRRLGHAGHRRVLAAAVPADPAELWTAGGAVAAAARMADAWTALLGARRPVDENLAAELDRDLGLDSSWAAALGDPSPRAVEVPAMVPSARRGDIWLRALKPDGTPGGYHYGHPYVVLASVLAWACSERPAGDPSVGGLAALLDQLRATVAAPDRFIPLGSQRIGGGRAVRAALFGPRTLTVQAHASDAGDPVDAFDDGVLIVGADDNWARPLLRTTALNDPAALAEELEVCAEYKLDSLAFDLRREAARLNVAALVERALNSPVPAGRYENDPSASVPGLVAEVAADLGASPDAAALYLQLLTLAQPTDKNVRRWNGWKPARHTAAQDELAALGAVVVEKRPRARRTAFVPGPWTDLKSPALPMEERKLEPYLLKVNYKKEVSGPFMRVLPPVPVHELFHRAWADR